jgi:hypothetical protein
MTGSERLAARRLILSVVVLTLVACKDADLGPYRAGSIEGQVVEYQTGEAIPGASITTTPPTDAITTDADGTFHMADLDVGNYQITARKHGYTGTSVSVSVREGRASNAVIFLDRTEDAPPAPTIDVDVIAWWHVTASADSVFVEAEYRVRNPGPASVSRYEVYFRITTDQNEFLHEEKGEALEPFQSNIRRFKTYIVDRTATDVTVDDVWVDG